MILKPDPDGSFTVSFLLIPEYAMVALQSAIEPMRVANRFAKREVFRWQLLSQNGEPVNASNKLALQQHASIDEIKEAKNIFICSSFNPEKYICEQTINWLKNLHRKGSIIGAMDTGCYLLAAANLLKDHCVTLHWEAVPAFSEDNPNLKLSNGLFEIDRNLITCAGGTAAIDMMLHIIQAELSNELAVSVCEQFIKSRIRQKSDAQRINSSVRFNIHHPRLLKVLGQMEETLDNPLSTKELADHAYISVRQLERLFSRHLGHSPSHYYLRLRLERARQLLRESHLSIQEISVACGFNSGAHFARSYRKLFDLSPNQDRSLSHPKTDGEKP
ncbi:MAG: GlxA family transcriptional regulator [Arenicella sp.]